MQPLNVVLYGREEPLPEKYELRAGPLTLVYEVGDLRYVRLGEQELLRRVYAAVRDRSWDTVAPVLSNLRMEIQPASFRISYEARHTQTEIDFAWKATITGDDRGTVRFEMAGEALSDFFRNRIGFCVLHPARECPGRPCVVRKPDGTEERGAFPNSIAPHQPFKEMRAISHEVQPGVWAEVRLEGDVFEMEDQRNWTDASFKIYCTPLALPYPVQVHRGDRISQSVTLNLNGDVAASPAGSESAGVTLRVEDAPSVPLPSLGLGAASHGRALTAAELARLRALHMAHLRVDLGLSGADWATALRRSWEEAKALNAGLEVALFLSDAAADELQGLTVVLEEVRPRVSRWLIFHENEKSTTQGWVRLARERLTSYDPAAPFGGGSNTYFTELNRERPPVDSLDLVCYSINPQVHAFDNSSLIENLEAQAATVESARQFAGSLPLAVGPVTLRPRFNPSATGPDREPGPGELPSHVDVRQMSLFGAGWTAGSLKYLAESGVASFTYYETTGWRGVMESETGSPEPELFRSEPGMAFPLYHVLADVGEFAGGEVVPMLSSDPLRVEGLLLRKPGRERLILANVSPVPQTVVISGWRRPTGMRLLDASSFEEAARSPEAFRARRRASVPVPGEGIVLPPYAVATLDAGPGS